MYAEKILGKVNVHRKNAQNRQCKGVRMLGNGNVRRKMLGIHNVHRKMLGIINAKWENARNY